MLKFAYGLLVSVTAAWGGAQNAELLRRLELTPAPVYNTCWLQTGDRLAICGDSITEQRMYSRMIEDYLTMCVPEKKVTVRQYGWSGERAGGFLARMTNDCLRFNPTVATTCYGMNDHEYKPYEERIGKTYVAYSRGIIDAFQAHGVRVVHGSPGCVGKMPSWVKSATGTVDDLNLNLATLRNLGVELARQEDARFADVFWPMVGAGYAAQRIYGTNFAIAGKDGVHPDWAGQAVMAYAFLKALGMDGEIGTFVADLRKGSMTASSGHEVIEAKDGVYQVRSKRYPFCVCLPAEAATASFPNCGEDLSSDKTIASVTRLIPFHKDLNRLELRVRGAGRDAHYTVRWGEVSKDFSGATLASGINLAEEFPLNPFCAAFAKVDAAVAAKQAFETRQVKQVFHGAEGKADMEAAVRKTEAERDPLARAVIASFTPVTHVLRITRK